MRSLLLLVFIISCIGLVSSVDFTDTLNHYSELGCKFVYSKTVPDQIDRCDCPFMKSDSPQDKCLYKGKEYELGQVIDNNINDHKCSVDCVCSRKYDGSIGFSCAQVECPEELHPQEEGTRCIRQYTMDSCCSEMEICDEGLRSELAVCEWNNETYIEGQRFYPKDTCYSCVCTKDFNDTLDGPWCEVINCGIELYHMDDVREKCAPVYFETRKCCPIEWTCMKESDVIEERATVKSNNPDKKCNYGNHTLDVGDEITGSDECVTCKCQVPPLVTCIRSLNC